ncbi:MAG: UDP-N-acetylmuramoyl-tripeptide--D-alanyl-D-alanine ligase [Proteobacteria bacterium]|nr:UDP-N-acetylmuramoyl-tripeptide--D-alanyl-D-alanine ligase [Pseudomonadota bacterium]MDA1133600.1 UDP-N-acetylmuramoyl-tripeptide--D-alanyl-D-alanine ligase [Pseudomonadota bacterium]
MVQLDTNTLLKILNVSNNGLENKVFSGISIDTRSIKENEIFIAIKGKNFNGHHFIEDAFEKGASVCIIAEQIPSKPNCIIVENTDLTLAQIAAYFVQQQKPKVIAITGSNGKTTTKEAILNILKYKFSEHTILATEGNLNNHIGLPLTLFKLKVEHKIAILEMGMNHSGEIDYLSKIAPPDIAVITNIGEAHIENFSTRKNIALAKKELLLNTSPTGTLILPFDDDYYELLSDGLQQKKITFGKSNKADIYYEKTHNLYNFYYQGKKIIEKIKFIAEHNAINFMCAIGVATELDFVEEEFNQIKNINFNIPHRLEFKRMKNGMTIIDDCYNANPTSMKKALDILSDMVGYKIAVIGDMAELGNSAKQYHQEIISYAENKNIDLIFRFGIFFKNTESDIKKNFWYSSKELLIESLKKNLKSNSIILVKGSRSMKMEDIIEAIQNF